MGIAHVTYCRVVKNTVSVNQPKNAMRKTNRVSRKKPLTNVPLFGHTRDWTETNDLSLSHALGRRVFQRPCKSMADNNAPGGAA